MPAVQRVGASEREPDSVERHRVVVPQALEPGPGRPAAQVVLDVNPEEHNNQPNHHNLNNIKHPQPDSNKSKYIRQTFITHNHNTHRSPFIKIIQDRINWRLAPTTLAQAPAGM